MTNYSQEVIVNLANRVSPVIIEFRDNGVEVGYIAHDEFGVLTLYPLEASYYRSRIILHRSYIKRIIHLGSGYVMPKKSGSFSKTIDILEMNELITKAEYEFI